MLDAGKLVNDRYALIAPIGAGRTATVWRATDQTLQREVAIKFLHSLDEPDPKPGVDQFLREARLCASIQHRNVMHTVDFGVLDERQPFMVMELLNGEDLRARMAREPRLGPGPFIHVITVALRGLTALHDAGIVHRDVKPQSIFLQRDSEAVYPKILDFGISRGGPRASLRPPAVVAADASPYMSPEQARGQSGIDKRSDVYSMAVILFEGLSGRLPFEAGTGGELVAKITTEEPSRLRALCPELPEPLSDLLAQAMSKDRDHRFADARAMRNAILSAAKTLLPATRRSSTSLTPAAPVDSKATRIGAVQAPASAVATTAPAERAGWGDFEGLARPAMPAAAPPHVVDRASAALAAARQSSPQLPVAVAEPQPPARRQSSAQLLAAHRQSSQQLPATKLSSGAQMPAVHPDGSAPLSGRHQTSAQLPGRQQNSVPLSGRHQTSAQLPGRHPSSAQLPAQRASGTHGAVQPGDDPQLERASVADGKHDVPPLPPSAPRGPVERAAAGSAAANVVARSSVEEAEPVAADALDPLYAGADQAAPEIDFERVRIHTKKALATRAQPNATQLGQAASQAGKPRGKPRGPERATTPNGIAWRTWLLSLLAVAALTYAYIAAGGFAAPAAPGAGGDATSTPATSPGLDEDLRKMRLQVKARRHKPGHMMPHLRDVEF